MASMQEMEARHAGPGVGAALLAFVLFAVIAAGSVWVAQRTDGPQGTGGPSDSYREDPEKGTIEMVTVMRQYRRRSETQAFRSAEMVTIAGNGMFDLSGARMAGDKGRLEVVVLGGRALVKVPPEWAVTGSDNVTLGSLVNHARKAAGEPERTLRLEAVILGGALVVTH